MIIDGKIVLTYDIKVFKNAFFCTFADTESDEVETYEISERNNQAKDIAGIFMYPGYLFCGYNILDYSAPIINFIIENLRYMPNDCSIICERLYSLCNDIIYSEDFSTWSKWKHTKHFLTIDLYTMLAAKKDRVGLKEAQITSGYPYIKEVQYDYTKPLESNSLDSIVEASINDAKSIKWLCSKCEEKIKFREAASKEFDINLLSKDNVSLGLEIVKKNYLERTGEEWKDIKDRRSPKDIISLNGFIPQFIDFKSDVLKNLVKDISKTTINITDKKQYENKFLLTDKYGNDIVVSFGMGGLHSIVDTDVIIPKDDELLINADVRSMYPTYILKYKVVPPHINKSAFIYIFNNIWEQRLKAKDSGDKVKSETYKNALVSIIGNYRVPTSWLYSPESAVNVNISCQLLILKLAEMLIDAGCVIKQINTDGILFIAGKDIEYRSVLDSWQGLSCLTLDIEYYSKVFQYNINNYLAIRTDGSIKKIGIFNDKQHIGKGMLPPIIAKSICEHFIKGADVEEFIKSSKNIQDFLTYQKVGRQYAVEYNDKKVQRINRYYASVNGCILYKYIEEAAINAESVTVHLKNGRYERVAKWETMPGGRYFQNENVSYIEHGTGNMKVNARGTKYEALIKSSGVTLANNLDNFKSFPSNINYIYYIGEAKKIISQIENRQLSLF